MPTGGVPGRGYARKPLLQFMDVEDCILISGMKDVKLFCS